MNILIFGPQGSGKGTQAKLLTDEFGLFYFESGDFLRKIAKKDERVDRIINKEGKLLPDEETFKLTKKHLEKNTPERDGMILDGYPRTPRQYELLKEWLSEKGYDIDHAILLEISEKESIRRLSARRVCKDCGTIYNLITNPPPEGGCECGGKLVQRPDDRPEAIKTRLEQYDKLTKPLIKIYEEEGKLMRVDGERPIEVIFEDIVERLKNDKEN